MGNYPQTPQLVDPTEAERCAFVALGSNRGDRLQFLYAAADRLARLTVGPFYLSSIWETAPVDCPPGTPPFLNAMVGFVPPPGLGSMALLQRLQQIESELGRVRTPVRNTPRTIDLDLITDRNTVCFTPELVLPHPRAHRRLFVLAPLAEIAPGLILPGQSCSVQELLARLMSPNGSLRRLSKGWPPYLHIQKS